MFFFAIFSNKHHIICFYVSFFYANTKNIQKWCFQKITIYLICFNYYFFFFFFNQKLQQKKKNLTAVLWIFVTLTMKFFKIISNTKIYKTLSRIFLFKILKNSSQIFLCHFSRFFDKRKKKTKIWPKVLRRLIHNLTKHQEHHDGWFSA